MDEKFTFKFFVMPPDEDVSQQGFCYDVKRNKIWCTVSLPEALTYAFATNCLLPSQLRIISQKELRKPQFDPNSAWRAKTATWNLSECKVCQSCSTHSLFSERVLCDFARIIIVYSFHCRQNPIISKLITPKITQHVEFPFIACCISLEV
jgi:hypothetical protein